mgnify:CR=1 FL=1
MMRKGPLAWMVDHGVAPNLMMVLFIVGGLMASLAIKKEVFPEFETEIVQVTISYPGATPEDVEQSLLLPVEAAIADVEGIDELTASASEGSGVVSATLIDGIDVMRAYQDIQQSVNAITTLPAAADPPRFTLAGRSRSVVSLQVYGNVGLAALHDAAENVRAELQATSGISRAGNMLNLSTLSPDSCVSRSKLRRLSISSSKKSMRIGSSVPIGKTSSSEPRTANSPCSSTCGTRRYPHAVSESRNLP